MLNATKNVDDVIRITGNQQQQIAISTAVVQAGPFSPGIYDVWSTVDCYIAVYPFRRADVLVSTPALTADIGYFLSANKTVSVRIEEGDVLQSLGVASGTLKYMNVQGQGVTSAAITPPVPVGPQAVVMPVSPFGSSLAWWDVSKTFTDSDGITKPLAFFDDVAFNSVSAIEDASGNGFLMNQPDKSLQPLRGASNGSVTDIAGHILTSSKKSLINGLSKLTIGFRIKPRSDLAVSGSARTLFYISRSTNSSLIRAAVSMTGGTTGRRVFSDFGIADSATAGDSRTTTSGSGPQLTNDVHNTLIVEYDLSVSPCTCSFYTTNPNVPDYVDSGLVPVTGSAPFSFGSSDSIVICLGDVGGGTARPSLSEIPAIALIADAGNATVRANLKSYLDATA